MVSIRMGALLLLSLSNIVEFIYIAHFPLHSVCLCVCCCHVKTILYFWGYIFILKRNKTGLCQLAIQFPFSVFFSSLLLVLSLSCLQPYTCSRYSSSNLLRWFKHQQHTLTEILCLIHSQHCNRFPWTKFPFNSKTEASASWHCSTLPRVPSAFSLAIVIYPLVYLSPVSAHCAHTYFDTNIITWATKSTTALLLGQMKL